MAEDIFTKKVGNKEFKSLEAKPVLIQGKLVEPVLGKAGSKNQGKEVGRKVVLVCKHPDREEPVKISSISTIVGKTVKSLPLFINLDEDGNFQKDSGISILIKLLKIETLNEVEGKTLNTELDEGKFLTIKGY